MLTSTLRQCRGIQIKTLLQHTNRHINVRKLFLAPELHTCLCRQHQDFHKNVRAHSTQSDQHRQKVVIETTEPKIVLDDEKVLPEAKLLDENTIKEFWRQKILPYVHLARWDRPIGVYLLYWPCTWSIALGSLPGNVPPAATLQTAALFLVGAGLMRGAGCTINDLWDRDIDKQVERTKSRPLASGAVSARQAVAFLALQLSLALGVLLQLNCSSVLLGASSLVLVVTYPLAKRFTNYPQAFLGATFNWGALLGYSALQGCAGAVTAPLYLAAVAWTLAYDTVYAHQDKADDLRIGVKSTALTFGEHSKPLLGGALLASGALLGVAGGVAGLAAPYYAALGAAAALAARQLYTLDVDNPDDCAKKFKQNSWIGLIILLGIMGGGYEQYVENRRKYAGKEDPNLTKSCVFG